MNNILINAELLMEILDAIDPVFREGYEENLERMVGEAMSSEVTKELLDDLLSSSVTEEYIVAYINKNVDSHVTRARRIVAEAMILNRAQGILDYLNK